MGNGDEGDVGAWRDAYVLWNNRLLETFFSPASRGEEVWLQVDKDALDGIGFDLGRDEGFIKAVKAGPPWGTMELAGVYVHGGHGDVVARVRGLVLQRWQRRRRPGSYCDPGDFLPAYAGRSAPTYLPFLVALARSAASVERRGYYNHLRDALDLDSGWHSQHLTALEHAWEDLEAWTKETSGYFGRFVFRRLGCYERIGVPASQGIVSRRDREAFPAVFGQVGARAGQKLSDPLVAAIKRIAVDDTRFSPQFRDALQHPELDELVKERLSAVFDDWDGVVPMRSQPGGPVEARNTGVNVDLCLALRDGATAASAAWRIHWRVPALLESGSVVLENGGASWMAPQLGSEPTTTTGGEGDAEQAAALRILATSGASDVPFDASSQSSDERNRKLGEIKLPKAILRVLVWRYDPISRRHELRESPLPSNGAAYLLVPRQNAKRLERYLEDNVPGHEFFPTTGLPEGWVLACVPDCSKLDDEQRATLPDGMAGRSRQHPIRLVGGRLTDRGGPKQYLSYDLPFVELDGPEGTMLQADGLQLDEEERGSKSGSAIRRFKVTQLAEGARRYDIVATHGVVQLGTKSLRVASNAGEGVVSTGGEFSVDPKGWPTKEPGGLRGLLPGGEQGREEEGCARFEKAAYDFGSAVTLEAVARIKSQPAALFLNTLAQHGSMAYGPARDHLAHLLLDAGEAPQKGPGPVFLELRARGHVEIETDAEGHMARIHAVQPGLYELAATNGADVAYGVLGTLRLQHWQSLAEASGGGFAYQADVTDSTLGLWRVLPPDQGTALGIASECGFELYGGPSQRIARWAASASEVRESIGQLAGEKFPGNGQSVEVFTTASGSFQLLQQEARLDEELESQLFRMPDAHAERLKVHVLAMSSTRRPRYGYVRDSSWGKWIAFGAFASYVRERHGINDASPWPIPYVVEGGVVWLPARVKLPFVLERALVLCSGSPPAICSMDKVAVDGGIELVRDSNRERIGRVSLVYNQMAKGKWLGYKWVPREVAEEVARKIGGAVAPT